MKRGKKAISNLVAIVIITLMCVILAAAVYNILIRDLKEKTLSIESRIQAISNIDLKILSVEFSGSNLKIILENTGKQDISSFLVRVTSSNQEIYLNSSVYIAEQKKLKPLETQFVLIIPAPFGNHSENYKLIEVYPKFEFQEKEEIAETAKTEIQGTKISEIKKAGIQTIKTLNLDFGKGVYSVDKGLNSNNQIADSELAERVNYLATLGVDTIQIYDRGYCMIIANSLTESGKALRNNKQKLLVSLSGHGGVLENNMDETDTNFMFLSASSYRFSDFADYTYSNSNYKTFWLDGECIQFSSFDMSKVKVLGYDIYRTIFSGIKRGCESTTPIKHTNGSIPINKEYLEKAMKLYASPENINGIFGYYAIDDSPIFHAHYVDYSGMQKMKHDIVRKYDSHNPIIYGQMGYSPVEYWWLKGTTNYAYVDALAVYVYPWRIENEINKNNTARIIKMYEEIRDLSKQSKMPKIYAVIQAFTCCGIYQLPTKNQVNEEINLHLSLGASGIIFFSAGYSSSDYGIIDNQNLTEAVKEFNP